MDAGTAAVLGGVSGALATMIGQWFMGPRVERRARAQETWERHVLELGRLLAEAVQPLRAAASSAYRSWTWHVEWSLDPPDEIHGERLAHWMQVGAERRRENAIAAREAHERWEATDASIKWLVARLRRYPGENPSLEMRYLMWHTSVSSASPIGWTSSLNDNELDRDVFAETRSRMDKAWADEAKYAKELADAVDELASGIVPFPRSLIGQTIDRVRRARRASCHEEGEGP